MLRFAEQTISGIQVYKNVIDCDDYYVKELSSGIPELIFSISIYNPAYYFIQEETRIFEHNWKGVDHTFQVKAIDAGEKLATIKCQYYLEDWQRNNYWGFAMEDTIGNIVSHVLPDGWTLTDNSGDSTTQLVELAAGNRLDVVKACEQLWPELTVMFDNAYSTATIVNTTAGQNLGAMVSRDLNLKKLTYKGKSTTFATRIYPLGKDGLKIDSVNGGLDYVQDLTYTNRVICAAYVNESIEDANELLTAAQEILADYSVPKRSYSCDIVDIAAASPVAYAWLAVHMFDKVTIVDDTRYNRKMVYSVVERWVYPYMPQKNKVVLSTTAPKLQTQLTSLAQSVAKQSNELQTQMSDNISIAINQRIGTDLGNIRIVDANQDGYPDTLYIADDADPTSALYVLRIDRMGVARSTDGYSGAYTYMVTWPDEDVTVYEDTAIHIYNGNEYAPQQITYLDSNNEPQTITVLAAQS